MEEQIRSDIFIVRKLENFEQVVVVIKSHVFSVDQVIYLSIFVRQYLYVILKVKSQSYR